MTNRQPHQTEITELARSASVALLAQHRFGRIAFSHHDRVDIEPISFAYDNGWLYARTSPGTKLTTMAHHPWVAFEVDDVVDESEWTSVVVRGALFLLSGDGGASDRELYDHAVGVLRAANPRALTPEDPTPHRDVLFRIHVDEVTGRKAIPAR